MLDFSQEKQELELIEEGEYELELKMEWAKTQAGDPYINCLFRIREDVNQEYKGRTIYDGIYRTKKTGEFNYAKIKGIIDTQPNPTYQFEDYDEVILTLNNTLLRAKVTVEEADESRAGSKTKNVIEYLSYKPTKYPTKKDTAKTVNNIKPTPKVEEEFDELDDESLPF